MKSHFILPTLIALASISAHAAEPLSLERYIEQVKQGNTGYSGSASAAGGALMRAKEGELQLSPALFGTEQLAVDNGPKTTPAFQGTSTTANSYSLGIQKLWDFGLTSKLSYNLGYTSIQGAPLLPIPTFYNARPLLELSLPVWANGFGRGVRAQTQLVEASALATANNEAYNAQRTLASAEAAYWRLAVSRDVLEVQKDNYERAQKLREWNARRARLRLGDDSDTYQADATLKLRRIELQGGVDEERSAALAFNSARGTAGSKVDESILGLNQIVATELKPPTRKGRRRDVEAAYQQTRAAQANSQIAIERGTPNLELFSSLSLTGQRGSLGNSVGDSFKASQDAALVGVRFVVPLEIGALHDVQKGYQQEVEANDAKLTRRVFDEEADWQDLSSRYQESRRRLDLANEVEHIQKQKYEYERERQHRGKSTTFVVLQFEQDYASARISRIRQAAEILNLIAQMKLYEGV